MRRRCFVFCALSLAWALGGGTRLYFGAPRTLRIMQSLLPVEESSSLPLHLALLSPVVSDASDVHAGYYARGQGEGGIRAERVD